MRRARSLVLWGLLVAAPAGWAGRAGAQQLDAGAPTISLQQTELHAGDRVLVTLTGWRSRVLTLSVCGNLAKRGAADCNMIQSQAVGLATNSATTLTEVVVTSPPTPCPCLVRAASTTQGEVALAPFHLIGAAEAPVVELDSEPLVDVSIAAHRAGRGVVDALRSSLAGPTTYRITVAVRNRSADPLSNVSFTASVGRGDGDELASFERTSPGMLGPGRTWRTTAEVRLPAPVLGRFVWQATASGAGPAAHTSVSVRRVPVLFVALVGLFVADLVTMLWRRLARRRGPAMLTASPSPPPSLSG